MLKSVTKGLVVWGAAGLLALTACGGDEPAPTVELDRERAESGTPEVTKDGTPETPDEPREGELIRGANVASTPQEKEVAEVWFTFQEEFVRVLGTPDPIGSRLSDVATGGALSGPLRYAGELAAKDIRLGGGMIATVLKIDVADQSAVVRGCFRNSMIEVDDANKPLEKLKPWYATKHTLTKSGNQWLVADFDLEAGPKCV